MTDILSPYSRRGLIGAGLGVGAGLLLPDSAMSASRPRRGGRIRAAGMTASTADTLDPAKGANSSDYIRHYMFYSLLTQLDRNLIPQLELAERIESSDQINWHIRLRKGITFHDGATLTAQDVVWTLMRHKNPATGSKMAQIAEQFAEI